MNALHVGPAPKGFKKDFESFLFNTRSHRLTQSRTGWKEFHWISTKSKTILGSIVFYIHNKKATSPFRAPFGSFEISNQLNSSSLRQFIVEIEKYLFGIGIREITISNPPELLVQTQPLVNATLVKSGYQPSSEIGCVITVDETPLELKMMSDKLKRLKRSVPSNLKFRIIPNPHLKTVYRFIESHFEELNRKLSLSYPALNKIVTSLPKSFLLVGAYKDDKLISACICVFVKKSILYTFYSSHNRDYNNISPRIFLMAELYKWSFQNNINLIDLGTSMLHGKINSNLLDFKVRIGGSVTPKYIFHKTLS